MKQFFGKYRGKVISNVDPTQLGRVQVSVPLVLGDSQLSWAMPCVPYGGPGVGFFAIPPKGANIWVEFEGGDPDYPIWSGCFWGTGEMPIKPALAETKVFKTEAVTLTLNDLTGSQGFTLEVNPPAVVIPLKMVFDHSGIKISAGPAAMTITPEEVELNAVPGSIKLAPQSIEIMYGAQRLELSPADISAMGMVEVVGGMGVSGAMEVTGAVGITGAMEVTGALEVSGPLVAAGGLVL